ncbi:MAG: YceD family protein, partial [Limisphaerales bacterium]
HLDLPDFAAHLPLDGEDAVPVVDDCVDLTPYLREDILLALPQHPLCKPDCRGLSQLAAGGASGTNPQTNAGASPWAVLNQLKLKE